MFDQTSRKITVRISKTMKQAMDNSIRANGYGSRGKSKWLSNAILRFEELKDIISFIEEGEEINQAKLCYVEAFYLPISCMEKLTKLMVRARKEKPLLNGVQSAIIRACIIAKLARI